MKTQTVTISDVSSAVKSEIPTKEVPIVHTETKTITYEAAQVGYVAFRWCGLGELVYIEFGLSRSFHFINCLNLSIYLKDIRFCFQR